MLLLGARGEPGFRHASSSGAPFGPEGINFQIRLPPEDAPWLVKAREINMFLQQLFFHQPGLENSPEFPRAMVRLEISLRVSLAPKVTKET